MLMMLNSEAVAAIEVALEEGYTVEVKSERQTLVIVKKKEKRVVSYKKELE